jgi:hypothetical protein
LEALTLFYSEKEDYALTKTIGTSSVERDVKSRRLKRNP